MTKIYISRTHKMGENKPPLNWVYKVDSSSKAWDMRVVDGVRIAETNRNYYFGKNSTGKIRYETMSAENSSAEYYRDIYVEAAKGVFVHGGIASNENIDEMRQRAVSRLKGVDEATKHEWKKTLVLIDPDGRQRPVYPELREESSEPDSPAP